MEGADRKMPYVRLLTRDRQKEAARLTTAFGSPTLASSVIFPLREINMSLLSAIKGKGPSGFGYGSTAEQVTEGIDLHGKTILVTGCNSGLGLETVRVLAKRGAHVIATARSVAKAEEACKGLAAYTAVACEL